MLEMVDDGCNGSLMMDHEGWIKFGLNLDLRPMDNHKLTQSILDHEW
jgi:hypothetical protein